PTESIVKTAKEQNADLIVMFTDGRDTVSDMMLGSCTERVLRETDVALLAVRK
ncbi:MAG: universal stress protein, partial [Desulfovibrio sp.]|nr:universal stress protein [Desulfovibrio sp.]